jgi:hypothetical protein
MNNVNQSLPNSGGIVSESIIEKPSVKSLASMFEAFQGGVSQQPAPIDAQEAVPQIQEARVNSETRTINDSQVEFIEPREAIGQNFRVQVVKNGKLVFDEDGGKRLRDEAVKNIKAARTSPDQFETRVGAYGKSVVGLGKGDAKDQMKEAKVTRSDDDYSSKETQLVERGISKRFDGVGKGTFHEVIAAGQIKPSHISAEILADLEVDNKIPANIESKEQLLEFLDHEIDAYPNHMLSNLAQPDLKGMTQKEAVKELTHKIANLYITAYPDKSLKDAYILARDAARVITYQTHYDLGHWSGSSHSIKHILHNIELAESMMKGVKPEHLTDKDKFLVTLVHIYHDIGYTVPMAQHTSNWPNASTDHPLTGGKFLEANKEYFKGLIGEAGFMTLRDSVFLHSHFNSEFNTSEFSREVDDGRVVKDPTIHPGIVRSVTSGSDCCAVSGDIKLQEFWMNPSVIKNTGRLQYAFQSMIKRHVAKVVAEKMSAMTEAKLAQLPLTEFTSLNEEDIQKLSVQEQGNLRTKENYMAQVKSKATKAAKGHIKFGVLIDPDKIRPDGVKLSGFDSPEELASYLKSAEFGEKLNEKINSAAEELAKSGGMLSKEEYVELLTTYASVKVNLVIDAWEISKNAASKANLADQKDELALAEKRFKSLVKAIDRNFNIMSVQKAFGQYGAKFQGIKIKEGGQVNLYTMISKWVPSKAIEHLRNTNSAAYAAWAKLGDELGIDEDEVELFINAYMNYREAKDKGEMETPQLKDLKQEFNTLMVKLNQDNAENGVSFNSSHGKLVIKGPKGSMVIKTKIPGDDDDVVGAFASVLKAVSDSKIRDELMQIKAFGESIKDTPNVDVNFVIRELIDTKVGNLMTHIADASDADGLALMEFIGTLQNDFLQADEQDFAQTLIASAQKIGNYNFGTDKYINEGIAV